MIQAQRPGVAPLSGLRHWTYDVRRFGWAALPQALAGACACAWSPSADSAIERADMLALRGSLEQLRLQPQDAIRLDFRTGCERSQGCRQFVVLACRLAPSGEPDLVVGCTVDGALDEGGGAYSAVAALALGRLADAVDDVVVVQNRAGVILHVSPAGRRVFGAPAEALVGRRYTDFVHPADRRAAALRLQAVARGLGEASAWDCRVATASGQTRVMRIRCTAMRDAAKAQVGHVVLSLRDVTDARWAERGFLEAFEAAETASRQAQASEQRHLKIAEATGDIMVHIDAHGLYTYVCPSIRRLGYEPEALIGRMSLDFLHPDDRERGRLAFRSWFLDGVEPDLANRTYRVQRTDGGYVWLEGSYALTRDASRAVTGAYCIYRDATERVALEAKLEQARAEAVRVMQAKSAFLANMSHELRTPLTSVIGYSQLIQTDPALPDSLRRAADRISLGGRSLLAVINDLLDVSKIEAGEMRVQLAPTPLEPLFRDTVDLLRERAREKNCRLQLQGLERLPAVVETDGQRVRQVLLNLLGNAIKFGAGEDVTLAAHYDSERQRLAVKVQDRGPGIPADQIERLFERFQQADQAVSQRYGGTGLGLAICRGLIEAMGGEIGVRSAVGEGALFWFELPARACEGQAAAVEQENEQAPLVGVRVLVVDDNPDCREVVAAILTSVGVEVTSASGYASALEATAGAVFDVILMDLRMQGMNGIACTRKLRSTPGPNRATPILLCSADSDAVSREVAALFNGLILKPFTPTNLLIGVASVLDEEPEMQTLRAG